MRKRIKFFVDDRDFERVGDLYERVGDEYERVEEDDYEVVEDTVEVVEDDFEVVEKPVVHLTTFDKWLVDLNELNKLLKRKIEVLAEIHSLEQISKKYQLKINQEKIRKKIREYRREYNRLRKLIQEQRVKIYTECPLRKKNFRACQKCPYESECYKVIKPKKPKKIRGWFKGK